MKRIPIGFLVGLLFLPCLAGCGPSGPRRAEVKGTVSFNGRPVDEGVIYFIPDQGNEGPSAGEAIIQGKYHLPRDKGPVVGKNRVELRGFHRTGKKIQDPTAPQGTLTEEVGQLFPPQYNEQSTLVETIQEGANTINFDIKTANGP